MNRAALILLEARLAKMLRCLGLPGPAWPELPEAIRVGIIAMIQAARCAGGKEK